MVTCKLPTKSGLFAIKATRILTTGHLWWKSTKVEEYDSGFINVEEDRMAFKTKFYDSFGEILGEIHHTNTEILFIKLPNTYNNVLLRGNLEDEKAVAEKFNDVMWKSVAITLIPELPQ